MRFYKRHAERPQHPHLSRSWHSSFTYSMINPHRHGCNEINLNLNIAWQIDNSRKGFISEERINMSDGAREFRSEKQVVGWEISEYNSIKIATRASQVAWADDCNEWEEKRESRRWMQLGLQMFSFRFVISRVKPSKSSPTHSPELAFACKLESHQAKCLFYELPALQSIKREARIGSSSGRTREVIAAGICCGIRRSECCERLRLRSRDSPPRDLIHSTAINYNSCLSLRRYLMRLLF